MKIGVSSYSFSRPIRAGKMTTLDAIVKAKEIGFDVIEFSTIVLPEIKEKCEEVGIEVGNYTIGADFINGSGGDLQAEIERVKGEVDIAELLGSPGMRHDATSGFKSDYPQQAKSFNDALPRLIAGCRAVTEYAAEKGIKTMVENHGFFCQDSERVEKLICGVNHVNFGVLVDIGNFLCVDENPCDAIGRLMPYAFHVHAKDFHVKSGLEPNPGTGWFTSRGGNFLRGAIIGHGNVPLLQCIRIMKKNGYNKTLSIEFEGMEETISAIEIGFNNLKRLVELA
jgi:sugar phosphate isomerase/epimerase